MNRGLQSVYILYVFILTAAVGDDCIYKECYCIGSGIYCSQRQLTAVPQKVTTFNQSLESLDFDTNMITRIPNGSLPSNLKDISMMSNPLTTIDVSGFDGSETTLVSLQFSTAVFDRLSDAFLRLKNLKSLTIYDSQVSDWNEDAMKNLGQTLDTLYVDGCGLTVWPSWMQYLLHITILSVSSNALSSLPDNALDNLKTSLNSLTLINNSLTSVPRALSNLTALQWLYLQENKIANVSWLPHASKLMTLSLHTNTIFDVDQLSRALQPYTNYLTHLDIQSNHLSAIPNFDNLTLIGDIDFTQNLISDPFSGSLPPGLYTLNLQDNNLPKIPRVVFSVKSVSELTLTSNSIREIQAADFPLWTVGVELGYNRITELTDISFPENSSIQFLNLNNNPISIISNNAFKNLVHLNSLNLQNTKFTRLPLGLASAPKVYYLDFSGNTNLVCTCLEKSLKTWITSMPSGNINGDCGLSSIYDFFAFLSDDCPE